MELHSNWRDLHVSHWEGIWNDSLIQGDRHHLRIFPAPKQCPRKDGKLSESNILFITAVFHHLYAIYFSLSIVRFEWKGNKHTYGNPCVPYSFMRTLKDSLKEWPFHWFKVKEKEYYLSYNVVSLCRVLKCKSRERYICPCA